MRKGLLFCVMIVLIFFGQLVRMPYFDVSRQRACWEGVANAIAALYPVSYDVRF